MAITTVSQSSIYRLCTTAVSRGYNPEISKKILAIYVEDAPTKTSRKPTPQRIVDLILQIVTKNSTTRSYSCRRIAQEVHNTSNQEGVKISASTVYQILTANGYKSCKQTVKPGLTDEMKKKRLEWCLLYKDWTLEDWKNVIFTDETSVQLGGVQGKRRVWRTTKEAYYPHVIKRRWKGFKEFMF